MAERLTMFRRQMGAAHASQKPFVKRKAFTDVLTVIRSSDASKETKKYAVTQIRLFIAHFPELVEESINAVYDICEDPEQDVRIQGYNTIYPITQALYTPTGPGSGSLIKTGVSERILKRNVDVLVQLLQCDAQVELAPILASLLSHLTSHPVPTLSVLASQLQPNQDQNLRDLVLRFLVSPDTLPKLASTSRVELVEAILTCLGEIEDEILVRTLLATLLSGVSSDRLWTIATTPGISQTLLPLFPTVYSSEQWILEALFALHPTSSRDSLAILRALAATLLPSSAFPNTSKIIASQSERIFSDILAAQFELRGQTDEFLLLVVRTFVSNLLAVKREDSSFSIPPALRPQIERLSTTPIVKNDAALLRDVQHLIQLMTPRHPAPPSRTISAPAPSSSAPGISLNPTRMNKRVRSTGATPTAGATPDLLTRLGMGSPKSPNAPKRTPSLSINGAAAGRQRTIAQNRRPISRTNSSMDVDEPPNRPSQKRNMEEPSTGRVKSWAEISSHRNDPLPTRDRKIRVRGRGADTAMKFEPSRLSQSISAPVGMDVDRGLDDLFSAPGGIKIAGAASGGTSSDSGTSDKRRKGKGRNSAAGKAGSTNLLQRLSMTS
ncbi:hypothetical protein DL96DRAFT_1599991 [Flagelloscypha sp. PMI_526]|nr:hypothetical protein DL96DRAFT_1599991 [Flagelloscypha sp. PMI_526]